MKKTCLRFLLIIQTALILLFPTYAHAQTYGQGPYGCGTYNNNSGSCIGAASSGALSNTGQNVLLFSSIGAVVVGAAIIIVLYKRRK